MEKFSNIKLTSSAQPIPDEFRVIPTEKTQAEFFISNLFAQYLILNKNPIKKIEINPDDSDKGSDVFMDINNEIVGIQLTRFTLHDLVQRQNIARKRCYEIIDLILKKVNVDFKINIHLTPANIENNSAPLNKQNLNNSLANEISDLLNLHLPKLNKERKWITCNLNDDNSKKIASTVAFEPIKFDMYSLFHGKNNLYLNYYFDDILFSLNDLETTASQILNKKNNGKADILIIWTEISEILYKTKELSEILVDKFSKSSFDYVFAFFYLDRVDLFNESYRFVKIK